MTQVADRTARPASPSSRPTRANDRGGRWAVVIVAVMALLCCGLCGNWAFDWKLEHGGPRPAAAERGALGGMNSYSLALMLGGLRGPLVMILWSKVESQKIDRDLEDVDTMIEWIRLLQPEFDTVHIFQIWNKAYNISALMVSTASKYTTILDAVDYARRVDAEKPGDMNILDQLARVFGEKLGGLNVQERGFYRQQFAEDSLTDANRHKAYPEDDATYRRMGLKFFDSKNRPLLTDDNMIDPRLLVQRYPQAAPGVEGNDGAELQYLVPYQPFPLGIPAVGMGYNYAKRAQVAMTVGGQKPLQLSDTVIDTYPAILLKQWSEFEQDRAIGYEGRAFGIGGNNPIPGPVAAQASAPKANVANRKALDDAIYCFDLSTRLSEASLAEYRRHLSNPQYVNPFMSYVSTMVELEAQRALTAADTDYARSFLPGADRGKLFEQAKTLYREALTRYERIVLTYYVETDIRSKLLQNGALDVDKLSGDQLDHLFSAYMAAIQRIPVAAREFEDQRAEYGNLLGRAAIRIQQLQVAAPRSILETH